MIRTLKGRGLVLLAAVPLLGVVPMAAGASAAGPGTQEGHYRAASKPPPKPSTHAKPKKHHAKKHHAKKHDAKGHEAHGKHAGGVTLRTGGPRKAVVPGRTYEWTFKVTAKGPKKSGKAVFRTSLPTSLAFVSGEKGCASKGREVVCDLGTVKKGRTVTGTIKAKVSRRARPGEKLRLRGTVTWGKAHATRKFPSVRVARTADHAVSKAAPATARGRR